MPAYFWIQARARISFHESSRLNAWVARWLLKSGPARLFSNDFSGIRIMVVAAINTWV